MLVSKLESESKAREMEQLMDENNKYKTAVDTLDEKYARLHEENEDLNTLGADMEQLTTNRNDLQTRLDGSEAERNTLLEKTQELMNNIREMDPRMEELQMNNNKLSVTVAHKEQEIVSLRDTLHKREASMEESRNIVFVCFCLFSLCE